jgi:hypothetical protein
LYSGSVIYWEFKGTGSRDFLPYYSFWATDTWGTVFSNMNSYSLRFADFVVNGVNDTAHNCAAVSMTPRIQLCKLRENLRDQRCLWHRPPRFTICAGDFEKFLVSGVIDSARSYAALMLHCSVGYSYRSRIFRNIILDTVLYYLSFTIQYVKITADSSC